MRAELTGLVVLHELDRALSIEGSQIFETTSKHFLSNCYGLSGGTWCVLSHEAVGAKGALQRALNYVSETDAHAASKENAIGFSWRTEAMSSNPWEVHCRWTGYCEQVLGCNIPKGNLVLESYEAARFVKVSTKSQM